MQNSPITMIVEIPKGSRNKYEVDHESGNIYLDRMLFTATRYPADYGYIPDTLAEDGDPLDALALVSEPTFPGCHIRIRPIGLFLMEDQGHPDHKVIGVPLGEPVWADIQALGRCAPTHAQGDRALLHGVQGPRREEDGRARLARPRRDPRDHCQIARRLPRIAHSLANPGFK